MPFIPLLQAYAHIQLSFSALLEEALRSICRILKEERNYILQMIKKIRASGCNVVLIQKSILRDAVTDLSLHYLVGLASDFCS